VETTQHPQPVELPFDPDFQVYTDMDQCDSFQVSYYDEVATLVVSAEALLRTKEYDQPHKDFLEPFGSATLVMERNGNLSPGWWRITRAIKSSVGW